MEKEIARLLNLILTRLSADDRKDIDVSAQNYAPTDMPKGFFLYVGLGGGGNVHGVTFKGTEFTSAHIEGYHPVRLTKIYTSGTTATNLSIIPIE
jgi:hypothetical protein